MRRARPQRVALRAALGLRTASGLGVMEGCAARGRSGAIKRGLQSHPRSHCDQRAALRAALGSCVARGVLEGLGRLCEVAPRATLGSAEWLNVGAILDN